MKISRTMQASTLILVAYLSSYASSAQPASQSSWLGVWNGKLEGLPGVTLTLAEDAGQLGGTVVFNMIVGRDSTAHIAGSSVHLLRHPQLAGDTLSFQVLRTGGAKLLQMEATYVDSEKLKLQCLNCGDDSPTAELVKSRP